MLAYAAADTAHLVALRNLLGERLIAAGRSVWAEEEFAALTTVRWTPTEDREPGWLRLKGAKQLPPRQLAILREVHGWRVEVASTTDRAEFRILGNEALFAIAEQAPRTVEELEKAIHPHPTLSEGVSEGALAALGVIRSAHISGGRSSFSNTSR